MFGVDGATARLVDPGAGGTIDVNLLNNRSYLDVLYDAPATPANLSVDIGSILDLEPEFELSGTGLGTLALDLSKAPTQLTDGVSPGQVKFRYWLTGKRAATGTVQLTYVPNTWSYDLDPAALPTVLGVTIGASFLMVVFPSPAAGFVIVDSSITDTAGSNEIQILKLDRKSVV